MIKDNFHKGDKYPNSEYFNEVAKASNRANQINSTVHEEKAIHNNPVQEQIDIHVINATGEPLPRFSILEIDDPKQQNGNNSEHTIAVLNHRRRYMGNKPNGEHNMVPVVTLKDLKPMEVGSAVIMGIVLCSVDVLDLSHRFAKPIEGDTTKLESSESGNFRLVLPPSQTGIQSMDVILGFGGGGVAPSDEVTVSVLYPARQWTHKLPLDGNENKLLWSESTDPLHTFGTWFMNACGLANTGTQPLPVMELVAENEQTLLRQKTDGANPLYYRNVRIAVQENFAQPADDGEQITEWKLVFDSTESPVSCRLQSASASTTGFVSSYLWLSRLASLAGTETPYAIVDYSSQWETTTDPNDALKMGHHVIAPHTVVGYSLAHQCTYKETKTIRVESLQSGELSVPMIVPIVKQEFPNARIVAEAEIDLYTLTEGNIDIDPVSGRRETEVVLEKIESIEEIPDNECIYAFVPEYQNDKPLVKGTDSIENNCDGKPLLGFWKDGNVPQLLYCENIPYGYCIPLKTITGLIKTTCDDCSPVYNTRKYTVAKNEIAHNPIFSPFNVDYKPSTRCQ